MTEIQSVPALTMLNEIADGNPAPEEKWFRRDDFDPTYGMRELREAERKGWVELDTSGGDLMTCRFRLTPAGRAMLSGPSMTP